MGDRAGAPVAILHLIFFLSGASSLIYQVVWVRMFGNVFRQHHLLGAALGAFLTDYAFIPNVGFHGTQMIAVLFNVLAGLGAWRLVTEAAAPSASPALPEARRASLAASPYLRLLFPQAVRT